MKKLLLQSLTLIGAIYVAYHFIILIILKIA
jgi:hypothetical protein